MTRLNVGCGGNPLEGYVNIDQDDLATLRRRYPSNIFPEGTVVEQWDVFNLPCDDDSIDEVNADSFVEHLDFKEEKTFFFEAKRVLKPGGALKFSTPDFEELCRIFLEAKDDWQDFFDDSQEAIRQTHWFGTYTYEYVNRWGYLTASFFGTQNAPGMFHKNGYTVGKINNLLAKVGFQDVQIVHKKWKGRDPMLYVTAKKS